MVEPGSPLIAFSEHSAELVERAAGSIVAVLGGEHRPLSGIHWRSGVIVTAEEALECDENIKVTLPAGRVADASLAGRDPTTDVAVLRFQPDGLPVATTADASLRAGQVVMAVGNHDGGPLAALGIVAFAGGAWHSVRGGTIDSLIRLDLALNPAGEGGALIDLEGRVIGMTVLGPRRRALSIPSSTVDRAVDQLLARGHIFRGYLGAGLQPMKQERAAGGSQTSHSRRGVLVVSTDPNGPSARAGILVGDIVTAWNGQPIERVREIMRLLGPESIGSTVDLELIRGWHADCAADCHRRATRGVVSVGVSRRALMVAVAIFSIDPISRRNLEQLPDDDPAFALVGIVDHPSSVPELFNQYHIDVLLADAPTRELLAEYRGGHYRAALVVLLDRADAEDGVRALNAGARAVLHRSSSRNEIIAAIKVISSGLVVLPPELLATLLHAPPADDMLKANDAERPQLTRRELEVLAAMADGVSNKAIARRLGISFHTAKFHVAAILAKLDADSRTEAVAKAAQSGFVML